MFCKKDLHYQIAKVSANILLSYAENSTSRCNSFFGNANNHDKISITKIQKMKQVLKNN